MHRLLLVIFPTTKVSGEDTYQPLRAQVGLYVMISLEQRNTVSPQVYQLSCGPELLPSALSMMKQPLYVVDGAHL